RAFREHTPPSTLWSYGELNPGPLACHASALPTELQPRTGPGPPRRPGLTLHGDAAGKHIHKFGGRPGGDGVTTAAGTARNGSGAVFTKSQ
ncbi:unnamed protein product, partial [marine sediment metagenome]